MGEAVSGRWPCSVCGKGVGANSVLCSGCGRWVHARCSGLGKRVRRVSGFLCSVCSGGGTVRPAGSEEYVDAGDGDRLEKVRSFCYLGCVMDSRGGVSSAVTARIRSAWAKWRELAPILLKRDTPFGLKGMLYRMCVRSAMLYSSETWAVKQEDVKRLAATEMRMLRWLTGVTRADRKTNAEVRAMLDIVPIEEVMRRRRLRWYGHVERMNDEEWVKRVRDLKVEGKRPRGRPRISWARVLQEDMELTGLSQQTAHDRIRWKAALKLKPANPSRRGENGR